MPHGAIDKYSVGTKCATAVNPLDSPSAPKSDREEVTKMETNYRNALNRIYYAVKDFQLFIEEEELENLKEDEKIRYAVEVMRAEIMKAIVSEARLLRERR